MIFYVKSRKDFLPQKSVFLFDATVPGYIFVFLSLILFTQCLRKQVGRGEGTGKKVFFLFWGAGWADPDFSFSEVRQDLTRFLKARYKSPNLRYG